MTRKVKLAAGILAGIFVFAGCDSTMKKDAENQNGTQQISESNTGTDSDLREISIVLDWYPNALHSFLYVASEKGYFAEEGLELKIQFPSNTNDALSLVAAGQADIGLYYQQDVILARANQNIPVKSIGAVIQSPLNIVLSLKDKNILSPADLAGKKIGYAGTELSEALVESMMNDAGVDYEQVTMIDVGFDLMSSMTTGNVDATIGCLVNHEVPQMEEEGFEVNYFFPDDFGVPAYYEGVFVVNDRVADREKEMLAGFLRAAQKGFDDTVSDPDGSLAILLENQNAENFPLSKTVEEKSLDILLPCMQNKDTKFLAQTEQMWQDNIDWLFEKGLLKRKISPADLMVEIL